MIGIKGIYHIKQALGKVLMRIIPVERGKRWKENGSMPNHVLGIEQIGYP